ncbi:MAG: VWA domain-containing protein [Bacillus sp. (in: firmicutes)]
MLVEFKYPFLFLLFLPVSILLFLYVKQLQNQRNNKKEGYIIAALRFCLFSVLIFALTVPQLVIPHRDVPVVFVLDRSASVKGSADAEFSFLEQSIHSKKPTDEYSIISFGDKPIVEQIMGTEELRISKLSEEIGQNHTNIESALSFASSILPNHGGRIVLLTDGNETIGKAKEFVPLLKNQSIELDAVLLQSENYEDMAISNIELPPTLYKGEQVSLHVSVDSNVSKKGTLHLYANNKQIETKEVDVKEGQNVFPIHMKVDQTGLVTYRAELETEKDAYTENNKFQAVTTIKTTPKILIVQNTENDQVKDILQSAGYEVDSLSPAKLPTSLSGYLSYQSIIFNNVPATSITEKQMSLMEKSVKDFGVGFLMAGGEDSFGLGGYFKTPIEKLLPVDMEIKGKKEMPSLGLMIVLDRSGSMSGDKLALAKEAAARSIELLKDTDTLGFIAFDDKPWKIVEPKPLKDKEEVIKKIRSIALGGGTEIYSSLAAAYEEMEGLDVKRKHIILLTDGQSATNNDYNSLLEEGKKNSITLSTVALGMDADIGLLEELAELGSGRYYEVQDSSVIPSILSRETVMASRTYIEDNPFYPIIQNGYSWTNLFQDGVPRMNAYIATTPKGQAQVPILSEKKDAVLAEWQYGLGKTVAFTSDINGGWNGDWSRWSKWGSFVNKMVTETLPQYDSDPYSVSVEKRDEQNVLTINSDELSTLPVEVSIVSQKGEKLDIHTKMTAPGKYEVDLDEDPGLYFINIKQTTEQGNTSLYQSGFSIPYSKEYLLKGSDKKKVEELLSISDGKLLTKEADSFRPLQEKSNKKQEITLWLIVLAFLLLFIEVAIRRFGLKVITFQQKNKPEKKNIQKINKKAASNQEQINDRGVTREVEKKKEQRKTKKKKQIQKSTKTSSDRESHLQQLLEMKRKKHK